MRRILVWLDARLPILQWWKKHAAEYYVPKNLNFFYFFGSLLLIILVSQFITGIWLTMFYTPTAAGAFDSVEAILRDVNLGWLLRYMHSTGASFIFLCGYMHLFRGLLYGSYQKPRELVWLLGMGLFYLSLVEAFFGYLLPWGQMSYWGAQVLTSLFGAFPWVGDGLTTWVRGDFRVGDATLHRFFALHVIAVPFMLVLFVVVHVVSLRHVGSNNPDGVDITKHMDKKGKPLDAIAFHPYYTSKELVVLIAFLILFFAVVFFVPDMGGYFLESANFAPANPLVTPEHITPLWYMTPFYSILRAIPNKLGGVIAMNAAMGILLFVPWLDKSPVRSMRYKGIFSRVALGLLVASFVTLGGLGMMRVTPTHQLIAQGCTVLYFAYFLLMPFYSRYEKSKPVPDRIITSK